jgi:eukaryotic-like serine/threonine-protein kinase
MTASTAGSVLAGRYQLEVPLGRGGFGQVWRARDVAHRRPVAVKLAELTDITDPELLTETIARFRREATTVAALRHENIVKAYDAGRVGSELFLVMELAEGASLAAVLQRRAAGGMGLFPVASVLDIAEQVCAGLGAAHAVGVVHRDIKPGNLMVAARLQVKIIDFGIARLLADNSPRLTLPTHALGTVEYISPEQAEGGRGDVDGRADLYSLGCVLYELLAGVPPFMAADPGEVLMMQLTVAPVPLSARRAGIPAALSRLAADLLAKDRAARPADAQQVIARIRTIRRALGAAGLEPAGSAHEADRATVLKSDRLAGRPSDYASTDYANTDYASTGYANTGYASTDGDGNDDPVGYGRTATSLPSFTPAGPASGQRPPGTPGPPGAPAPRGTPASTGAPGPVPSWPQPQERRPRRRRLRTVVSTLITIAILAGAGAYAWAITHHPPLKVTDVAVGLAQQPGTKCDVTVDVVGTIITNGNGGKIEYQWVQQARDATSSSPVGTLTTANGQSVAQVQLHWTFVGVRTEPATAELRVLSPAAVTGRTDFTYSCDK